MKSRIATFILTTIFLGVMFGGLFNLSMGMSMTGDMSGCPFMEHGEALCSMSVFEHFDAWESVFMATVPTLGALLAVLAGVVALLVVAPNLVLSRKLLYCQVYTRDKPQAVCSHPVRALQELFSNGILHPKLF